MSGKEDVRVLLVDDHLLVRYGMRAMLDRLPGFCCVAEAATGLEGIELAKELKPDIAVIDIDLGKGLSGFDVASRIRQQVPQTKILMLTGNPKAQFFQQAIQLGCDAYVLKVDSDGELTQALEAVAAGEKYLSKSFTNDVFQLLQQGRGQAAEPAGAGPLLTKREKSTAYLVSRGMSDTEIAQELDISPKTVRVHKSNIKRKCGCKTSAELILFLNDQQDLIEAG